MRVLSWEYKPGCGSLPFPNIEDDSAAFDPSVVKACRSWLTSQEQAIEKQYNPSAQILSATGVRFKLFDKLAPTIQQGKVSAPTLLEFELGTIEVNLKDRKSGLVLARYHFQVAREVNSKRVIIGKFLRTIQEGTVA